MNRLAILIAAALLAGCITDNPPDPYKLSQGNAGLGTICNYWAVPEGSRIEADSTATCKDGTAPRLYYVQWLSDNRACTITTPEDVKGGKMRRVWGCRK